MYYLNKIVGGFLNPLGIGLLLLLVSMAVGGISRLRGSGRFGGLSRLALLLSFAWLWFWSLGLVARWIGLSLEREFPPQLAEQMPSAEAIVVLGGGVSDNTNACPYVDLCPAADRVWHGARLYRAGKAPQVFVTCEADAAALAELGVPRKAISGPSEARNTEEEARFVAGAVRAMRGEGRERKPKILLVTSAWHMRRAKLMFDKYAAGVEVVAAAADHMSLTMFERPLKFKDFVPDPEMLGQNACLFKELLAYWGYRVVRR